MWIIKIFFLGTMAGGKQQVFHSSSSSEEMEVCEEIEVSEEKERSPSPQLEPRRQRG